MDNYYPLIHKPYDYVTYLDCILSKEEIDLLLTSINKSDLEAGLIGDLDLSSQESIELEKQKSFLHRKSNTIFLEDFQKYDWLYKKLSSIILQINCLNYNHMLYGIQHLQYTEYDSMYHGFYDKHEDAPTNINHGLTRILSFTIQLSDDDSYTGGEVLIYTNPPCSSKRSIGSMTIFPSNVVHEVTPVKTGFRKSLVGWVVGPRL